MEREVRRSDTWDPAVVTQLEHEINQFNFATTGDWDGREFLADLHDDDGTLIAGVSGWTWGGTGWIDRLWVREDHREHGLGTRLLGIAAEIATGRHCRQLALSTHSFQAPAFYSRHGFEVVGEIPDYPAGHSYFLMRCPLGPGARV